MYVCMSLPYNVNFEDWKLEQTSQVRVNLPILNQSMHNACINAIATIFSHIHM